MVKVYMEFLFRGFSLSLAECYFAFCPEHEPDIQLLFITYFSHQFLKCTGNALHFQTTVKHLSRGCESSRESQ